LKLKNNIFIHGKSVSIGCLAMGDEAIEELFLLTHKIIGRQSIKVTISPQDPRKETLIPPHGSPAWTQELYHQITVAAKRFTQK